MNSASFSFFTLEKVEKNHCNKLSIRGAFVTLHCINYLNTLSKRRFIYLTTKGDAMIKQTSLLSNAP